MSMSKAVHGGAVFVTTTVGSGLVAMATLLLFGGPCPGLTFATCVAGMPADKWIQISGAAAIGLGALVAIIVEESRGE